MKVNGSEYRTIWVDPDGWRIKIIDQTRLPHDFEITTLATTADAAKAIRTMMVRGAPLIGATAAYGICLAMREDTSDTTLNSACMSLEQTRPTAVNLRWALNRMRQALKGTKQHRRVETAYLKALRKMDLWIMFSDIQMFINEP